MAEENYMNQGPDVSPQVGMIGEETQGNEPDPVWSAERQNVESGGMQQRTEKSTRAARVTGGEVLDQAKERFRTFKQDTDDYVRQESVQGGVHRAWYRICSWAAPSPLIELLERSRASVNVRL